MAALYVSSGLEIFYWIINYLKFGIIYFEAACKIKLGPDKNPGPFCLPLKPQKKVYEDVTYNKITVLQIL